MNILDKIIIEKRKEVELRKKTITIEDLKKEPLFSRKCISLKERLRTNTAGIIAEFKRKSPSKDWINQNASVIEITSGYCKVGASGISVLTDELFFGGSLNDLMLAREQVNCPLLRKDFMIDDYQFYEAKAAGADVILQIAATLTVQETEEFASLAKSLGMEVLLEIHNQDELAHINPYVDMMGVNNRNLKTFEVDLNVSKELAALIPDEYVKISESGISKAISVIELKKHGFEGFLMGENFMKTDDPEEALRRFINEVF